MAAPLSLDNVADVARCFASDYPEARQRFRAAASAAGARLDALAIEAPGARGETLTIDLAWLGSERPSQVVFHTTGLHGVEGFAGSAIQVFALSHSLRIPGSGAMIFVHGLNPWGMSHLRRGNENNVDLNRNCLTSGEAWTGAPERYRVLDPVLNPPSPSGFDFFRLRLGLAVLQHGYTALKQAVAEGQYEYPQGLFYGGKQLEQSPRLLFAWLAERLSGAQRIVGIDVHTGLGPFGSDTILVEDAASEASFARIRGLFAARVERSEERGKAYRVRGGLDLALMRLFEEKGVEADMVVQEYGTYGPLTMLVALREENRWHHHGGGQLDHPSKRRMLEVFCPAALAWRRSLLRLGWERFVQAYRGVFGTGWA